MSSEVSAAGADQDLRRANEQLARELAETREQQAATAQILAAISSSPTDPSRVFTEIAVSAARLCDASNSAITHLTHGQLRLLARHGPLPNYGPVGQGTLPFTRGSVVARAIIDRQTIHVADLQAETDEYPEASELARRLGHRTIVVVPLMRAGEAIGAIAIRRAEVRPFTDRQIELLKTFADQAVIAIENTRLFEEVQASLEYQTATSEILTVISRSPTDAGPVFETIGERAEKLCDAQISVISMVDGELIRLASIRGMTREGVEAARAVFPTRRSSATVTARTIRTCAVVHVPDVLGEPAILTTRTRMLLGPAVTAAALVCQWSARGRSSERSSWRVLSRGSSPTGKSNSSRPSPTRP